MPAPMTDLSFEELYRRPGVTLGHALLLDRRYTDWIRAIRDGDHARVFREWVIPTFKGDTVEAFAGWLYNEIAGDQALHVEVRRNLLFNLVEVLDRARIRMDDLPYLARRDISPELLDAIRKVKGTGVPQVVQWHHCETRSQWEVAPALAKMTVERTHFVPRTSAAVALDETLARVGLVPQYDRHVMFGLVPAEITIALAGAKVT